MNIPLKKSNSNVVILGFDGMDDDLTRSLVSDGHMPNLNRILNKGDMAAFESVFPPDSIPAWITAFTGKDPSQHGVIDHVNYLIKGEDSVEVDTSIFHGKTFWDRISDDGSEVCIVNPFMAYPSWDVNGAMVSGPVFIDGEIQVSNLDYVAGIPVPPSIGGIVDLPNKRNMSDFLANTIRDTKEQARFGLRLLEENNPQLFFQTFLTTDRIQHHLWRYCNEDDPTYPGDNPLKNSIIDFFSIIDEIIGQFEALLGADDILLIVSDHGHGMRCTHTFNINEYLRQEGLLYHNATNAPKLNKVVLEKTKNYVLSFMRDYGLEDYMHVVAKFVPNAKSLKNGEHINKSTNTKVRASSFAGVNPFGGIEINNVNPSEYTSLRELVINKLDGLEYRGKKIFKWIRNREDIYSGENIGKYPDILFEMIPELGTGMSMYSGVFTKNPTHKKVSGGHKKNGVFICNRDDLKIELDKCNVNNFYATVLSLFDVLDDRGDGQLFLVSDRNC